MRSAMTSRTRKRLAFDAATLTLLDEICESTWAIVEARYPLRDFNKDPDLRYLLRKKLFILAENSDLNDPDGLQRTLLEAFSRGIDY
jgi:hypothetical protein